MKHLCVILMLYVLFVAPVLSATLGKTRVNFSDLEVRKIHHSSNRQHHKNFVESHDSNKKGPPKARQVINSIGRRIMLKGHDEIVVRKYPYKVVRCDQIVELKAKFINDMGDYRKRSDGWFTITSHYVNLFKDEKYTILLRSVLQSQSPSLPSHIRGAKGCVLVKNPMTADKDISICLDNLEQEKTLRRVFAFFQSCRGADDPLNKINKLKLAMALKNCGGGKFMNPYELLKKLRAKHQRKKLPYIFKSKFWHPGSDRVPGTPTPPKKHHKNPDGTVQAK